MFRLETLQSVRVWWTVQHPPAQHQYNTRAVAVVDFLYCVSSNMKVANTNRQDKLIRKACSVVGVKLHPLRVVAARRILSKLL